jgi:hypothetical protein
MHVHVHVVGFHLEHALDLVCLFCTKHWQRSSAILGDKRSWRGALPARAILARQAPHGTLGPADLVESRRTLNWRSCVWSCNSIRPDGQARIVWHQPYLGES